MKTIEIQIHDVLVVIHYNKLPMKEDLEEACIKFIQAIEK